MPITQIRMRTELAFQKMEQQMRDQVAKLVERLWAPQCRVLGLKQSILCYDHESSAKLW